MENVRDLIIQKVGGPGRILSMSKSEYRLANPKNAAIFNANIIACPNDITDLTKVWYGDIDYTLDRMTIECIAKETGTTIYILKEMDARFDNEQDPDMSRFVFSTDGSESVIGEDFVENYVYDIVTSSIVKKP